MAKTNEVYLIGAIENKLHGRKLPTRRQVLSLFLYNHNSGLTIRQSSKATIIEVNNFWIAGQIPTKRIYYSMDLLEKLYKEWQNLQKSSKRVDSPAQKENERQFGLKLDELFDITLNTALDTLSEDQILFITSQRQRNRRGFVNNILGHTEELQSSSIRDENENADGLVPAGILSLFILSY